MPSTMCLVKIEHLQHGNHLYKAEATVYAKKNTETTEMLGDANTIFRKDQPNGRM